MGLPSNPFLSPIIPVNGFPANEVPVLGRNAVPGGNAPLNPYGTS